MNTMNISEPQMNEFYRGCIDAHEEVLPGMFGHAECLSPDETPRSGDYDRVFSFHFDPEARKERHRTVFAEDCRRAHILGSRLAEKLRIEGNIMKKVTIFIGSPRKHGSTRILATEAERGLRDQGINTETVSLNDLKIRGCQACYYCKKNDVAACAVQDDMQEIHALMQESDGFILATPIYFAGVTAQTKAWLDRLFPYIGMDLSPKLPGSKKISFIFTQNQPDARIFEVPIATFMKMVGLTGLSGKDHLIAYDLDAGFKTPVNERKDFMEKAYQIGCSLLE